jgi:cation diffusion facilitator CzcD-associated flavoprotein CzcO
MRKVAKKHDVYENTRFQTEVLRATWIEDRKQWRLDLKDISPTSDLSSSEVETVYFDVLYAVV